MRNTPSKTRQEQQTSGPCPQAQRCPEAPPPPTPEGVTPPPARGAWGTMARRLFPTCSSSILGTPTQAELLEGKVAIGQGQSQDIFGAETALPTRPYGGNPGRPHVVLPLPKKGGWQVPQSWGEMHEIQTPCRITFTGSPMGAERQPIEKWLKISEDSTSVG